jgi:ankyrin repeat protein
MTLHTSLSTFAQRRLGLRSVLAVCLLPVLAHAGAFEDFFLAARTDKDGVVRDLIAKGLDPNMIEPERGESALIVAVRESAMRVVALLLATPGVNINATAANGDTALMVACYGGNRKAVDMLLAKGAQVNKAGWTPLHYAAAIGDNETVKKLLDRNADLDARSPNMTTPLMMAARSGHILTVKLLHDSGADATLRNELGLSAIDFAARSGHRDIVDGLTYRLQKAGQL